jgi:hypothetical protein
VTNVEDRFQPPNPELLPFLTVSLRGFWSEDFKRGHPERTTVVFLSEVPTDLGPVFVRTTLLDKFISIGGLTSVFRAPLVESVARLADVEDPASDAAADVHQVLRVAVGPRHFQALKVSTTGVVFSEQIPEDVGNFSDNFFASHVPTKDTLLLASFETAIFRTLVLAAQLRVFVDKAATKILGISKSELKTKRLQMSTVCSFF